MFKTRHVVVILCITALAIMLVPTDALAQEVEGANTVTVSAREKVDIEPDLAIVVFGTHAKSRDASKALDNLAAKTNAVLRALRDLGLQDNELSTTGVGLGRTCLRDCRDPNPRDDVEVKPEIGRAHV